MICPKCGNTMRCGAPHCETIKVQHECSCGHIECEYYTPAEQRVNLLVEQTQASYAEARAALQKHDDNFALALLELTENKSEGKNAFQHGSNIRLKKLEGKPLEKTVLRGFRKIRDLIYFDGAVLSHFKNADAQDYLYLWVDCDSRVNRWLVFAVDAAAIERYLARDISLFHLMRDEVAGDFWLVDLDEAREVAASAAVALEDLDAAYIPPADSFYEFSVRLVETMEVETVS